MSASGERFGFLTSNNGQRLEERCEARRMIGSRQRVLQRGRAGIDLRAKRVKLGAGGLRQLAVQPVD